LARLPTGNSSAATDRPADPGAHALSVYLSALGLPTPTGLSQWLSLVGVLALELGSALAGLLVASVGGHGTASVAPLEADTRTETRPAQLGGALADTETRPSPGNPPDKPRGKRTPRKPAKRTRDTKRRLGNVVDLLKARGGQVRGGQRAMAKQLKLSKSRVNELLREAADAGVVKLKTSKRGTTVALVA
jgi:hypothetical protein